MTKVEYKIPRVRARAYKYAEYYVRLQRTLKECPQYLCIHAPEKLYNHLNKLESEVFNVVCGDYEIWVELK